MTEIFLSYIIIAVALIIVHLKFKIQNWLLISSLSILNILILKDYYFNFNYKNPLFYYGLLNIVVIILIANFPAIYRKIRNIRNELLLYNQQRPLVEKIVAVQKDLTDVEKRIADLEISKEQLSNIYDSLREIIIVLKPNEILNLIETIFIKKIGLSNFTLYLKDNNEFTQKKEYMINTDMKKYLIYFEKSRGSIAQFLSKIFTPYTIQIKDEWNFQDEVKQTNLKLCIFFPFSTGDEVLGAIVTFIEKDMIISDIVINNATIAAKQITMGIKKVFLYKKVEELSLIDGLTKLYLHRVFKERLENEIVRANRYKLNLSLLMMDIDHFKEINDNYGHINGDMVLEKIGTILNSIVKPPMIAARYGGEEFSVICPNYKEAEALRLAEYIRETIQKTEFEIEDKKKINLTISIGVFSNRQKLTDSNSMITGADKGLYIAKNKGRNRVEMIL